MKTLKEFLDKAKEIRSKHGNNPFFIATQLGIEVQIDKYFDFIDGYYSPTLNKITLFCKPEIKSIVCGHELGEYFFWKDYNGGKITNKEKEEWCEQFGEVIIDSHD